MNSPQRKTAAVFLDPFITRACGRPATGRMADLCGNAAGRAVRGACGDADKRGDEFAGGSVCTGKEKQARRCTEGGPGAQALVDPQLYTRAEVQGMSAREVRENYDAIRESMEMWDENGELQGGTQSRMVDRQAPEEDNETTSGNERLYTRAEVQGMSEEEQLANVDAIRESMGLWDAEGKLSKESEITIEEVRDDFEQIKHIKNLENFVEDPLLLKDVSPETLYCFLEKQGYTILPLAQSKTLTGIHYKDGGGFKVDWGGDRILQYHPATGSHHNGAYYKISSGKTGKVRIDLHGNKI